MIISTIENERFLIRPVTMVDEEQFMRIQQENSEMRNAFKDEHFRKSFWEKSLNSEDDIYMMIYLKKDSQHIGNCSFQNVNTKTIEIGIDIDKTMQNQGLGTGVLMLLVEYLKSNASGQRFQIKTKSNNIPCQRMIEKAGGTKIGKEATEFDRVMNRMIPTLEQYGMVKQIDETKKLLERNNGIYAFIYEFTPEP